MAASAGGVDHVVAGQRALTVSRSLPAIAPDIEVRAARPMTCAVAAGAR